jgi:hypothetical protein
MKNTRILDTMELIELDGPVKLAGCENTYEDSYL